MNNLILLMKNNFINEMGINKLKQGDKKEKVKAIGMAMMIFFTIIMLVSYGFIKCFYL